MFAPVQQNGTNDNAQQPENVLGLENARRQQVMRFALMICLLFLLLDSGNQASKQSSGNSSSKSEQSTEVPLGDQYSSHIDYILQQQAHMSSQKPMNATGLYRGRWGHSAKVGSSSGSVDTNE